MTGIKPDCGCLDIMVEWDHYHKLHAVTTCTCFRSRIIPFSRRGDLFDEFTGHSPEGGAI